MLYPPIRCRVLAITLGIRRRVGVFAWDAVVNIRPPVAPQSFGKHELTNQTAVLKQGRFSERATCLPRRGLNHPTTTRCPPGWYWSAQLMSCAPANPEALSSSTCAGNFVWSPTSLVCQRAASPSRRSPSGTPSRRPLPSPSPGQRAHHHKLKSRTASLCPAELDACPILSAGDLSDYECVDPRYDLQHCGGCSMDGRGKDCTTIEGAWNVECIRARCSGPYIHHSP